MSLPPAEELSRWTVGHVSNWLSKSSLAAFRDDFLRDGIDGSKLMRMQPHEVDARYNNVHARKRQILKEHLSKIEGPKSPPSWNTPPQLPPRPGVRGPAPPPQQPDDDDGSDDGWGDDFEDDDIDEEYLEPTTTPPHIKQAAGQGHKVNGHHHHQPPDPEEPQSEYEIPGEDLGEVTARPAQNKGFQRKPTLVDRLKNELEIRKRESEVPPSVPPPRPPRTNKTLPEGPSYTNTRNAPAAAAPQVPSGRHWPPTPAAPPPQGLLPPEAEYEIVNDFPAEPEKAAERNERKSAAPHLSEEAPLPPRPVKKTSVEKPPPPAQQQGGWLFNNNQVTPARKEDPLNSYEWYHGKITRAHAESIFHREQKDGMFLIRKSERNPQQPYTLVIWHCNRIWNIPIRKVGNKFAAGMLKEGETRFSSLPDLVEHFKVVSLNLKSNDQVQGTHNLTLPAPRQ